MRAESRRARAGVVVGAAVFASACAEDFIVVVEPIDEAVDLRVVVDLDRASVETLARTRPIHGPIDEDGRGERWLLGYRSGDLPWLGLRGLSGAELAPRLEPNLTRTGRAAPPPLEVYSIDATALRDGTGYRARSFAELNEALAARGLPPLHFDLPATAICPPFDASFELFQLESGWRAVRGSIFERCSLNFLLDVATPELLAWICEQVPGSITADEELQLADGRTCAAIPPPAGVDMAFSCEPGLCHRSERRRLGLQVRRAWHPRRHGVAPWVPSPTFATAVPGGFVLVQWIGTSSLSVSRLAIDDGGVTASALGTIPLPGRSDNARLLVSASPDGARLFVDFQDGSSGWMVELEGPFSTSERSLAEPHGQIVWSRRASRLYTIASDGLRVLSPTLEISGRTSGWPGRLADPRRWRLFPVLEGEHERIVACSAFDEVHRCDGRIVHVFADDGAFLRTIDLVAEPVGVVVPIDDGLLLAPADTVLAASASFALVSLTGTDRRTFAVPGWRISDRGLLFARGPRVRVGGRDTLVVGFDDRSTAIDLTTGVRAYRIDPTVTDRNGHHHFGTYAAPGGRVFALAGYDNGDPRFEVVEIPPFVDAFDLGAR